MTALSKVVAYFASHDKADVKEIDRFIETGVDVNEKDEENITALMVAAMYGSTKIIRILIARGADILAEDNEGHTALLYAQDEGHTEAVKLLEEAINNKKSNYGLY